jgi:hypothetical protein
MKALHTEGPDMAQNQRRRDVPSMRSRGHERRLPETKSFVLSSEFWVAVAAAAAMLFAGYVIDDLRESTAWRYVAFVAIAYIVSRGLAKAGSRRGFEGERAEYGRTAGSAQDEWAERRSGVFEATNAGTSAAPAGRDVPSSGPGSLDR